MGGRSSTYDHDVYLHATHPAALLSGKLSFVENTARVMMHVLIQFPRLVMMVRDALRTPGNPAALASAISLAENLWQLTQEDHFAVFINRSVLVNKSYIDDTVIDILEYGLHCNTSQDTILCTRYWLLQVLLSGAINTLRERFPKAYVMSLLPDSETLHRIDTDAAAQLGRILMGLGANSPSPLMLVRLHVPLSASIGSWHRCIRYLSSQNASFETFLLNGSTAVEKITKARRMECWLLSRCNMFLTQLRVSGTEENAWLETLEFLAGGETPDWIPTKVSFGSEDGEVVMQLEYSSRNVSLQNDSCTVDHSTRVFNIRNPAKFGPQHLQKWVKQETKI